MDADLVKTVARSPFLSLLPAGELRRLLGYGTLRSVQAGTVLFAAGLTRRFW